MKLLYLISPTYMSAFRAETEDYSFKIQGYPSIQLAHEGLHKRNVSDLLGFVYFSTSLPRNYKAIIQFLERVDMIAPKGMIFMLAVQDGKGFDYIKESFKPINLKIKIMSGWEDVTDIVIKSCLATFVLENFKPYADTEIGSKKTREDIINFSDVEVKSLKYKRLFRKEMLELISKVNLTPVDNPTVEVTVLNDTLLNKLSVSQDMFYRVRLAYVQAHFGIDTMIPTIQKDLVSIYNSLVLANAVYRDIQEICNNAINSREGVHIEIEG